MSCLYRVDRPLTPTLNLTSVDHIWLCRMIVGEQGGKKTSMNEHSALLWAMINRYLLHPGKKNWPNFMAMLRAFSQPINPRWMRGGDLAELHKNDESCSEERLDRRERICALTFSEIPENITDTTDKLFIGELSPPKVLSELADNRISNWASYKGVAEKYPGGVWIGGNYFFADKNLNTGHVVVDHFYRGK